MNRPSVNWGSFFELRPLDRRGRLVESLWDRPVQLAIDGHAYRRRSRRRRP